jgi:hypothetical protein
MIAVGIERHSRLFFALFASNVCCRLPPEEDEDDDEDEDAEVVTKKRPQRRATKRPQRRVQKATRPLLPLPVALLPNLVVGLVTLFAEKVRKSRDDGSSSRRDMMWLF